LAEQTLIGPVEAIHWNPRKWRVPRVGTRFGPRLNNFGDLLGPLIVERIARHENLVSTQHASQPRARLLSVGSVIHFGRDGDVVWGSGVNGKMGDASYVFRDLDVRAVRGPKTQAFLEGRGVEAPSVYGDPALLLADLFPEYGLRSRPKRRSAVIMPNLNDIGTVSARYASDVVLPTAGLMHCLHAIAESEYVVASSLHAIVIAESLGIPSRLVLSRAESRFKYEDYYLGTGRDPIDPALSVESALADEIAAPALTWNPAPLLRAFPRDLWQAEPSQAASRAA
jgi:pyruvyltransferase